MKKLSKVLNEKKIKDAAKKISKKSNIEIKPGKGWFEDAMTELDKKDKK